MRDDRFYGDPPVKWSVELALQVAGIYAAYIIVGALLILGLTEVLT